LKTHVTSLSAASLLALCCAVAPACGGLAETNDIGPDPADSGWEDSGAPEPPSLQTFLLDWYADYDANESVGYLDDGGTWEAWSYAGIDYSVVRDAHYGPHGERTSLDIYLPESQSSATPVVLFIHGGGFRSKDKTNVSERADVVAQYLAQGIAVASINYRFRADGLSETVAAPAWDCKGTVADNDGCRLDIIYRDGARAVQYLRYRSTEFNLDPDRIGAWGRSAGSQIATWVALVPDLAVADHPDPVLRQSTRLQAVGHTNSQATGPSYLWVDLVVLQLASPSSDCDAEDLWRRLGDDGDDGDTGDDGDDGDEQTGFNDALQSTIFDLENTPGGQDLIRVVHFLDLMDASAPPFITSSPVRDLTCDELAAMTDDALKGKLTHHPRHSDPLYARCLAEKGPDECEIVTDVQDSYTGEDPLVLNEGESHAADFIGGWLLADE